MKYLILLLLISCGKHEIEVNDSNHSIGGETRSRILIELPFINQVNTLCKDLNIRSDFASDDLHRQEIARCTFENISILNIGGLDSEGFDNVLTDICSREEYQDQPICQ